MPWPHFLVMFEAIARGEESPSTELDKALGIQALYREHRAQRSAVSRN